MTQAASERGFFYSHTLGAECKAEFLKAFRMPSFAVPTLIFPLVFYTLFGVVLNEGVAERAAYMLATYGIFAALGPSMFAFGVAIATERDRGWLEVKRAAPMPFSIFLIARLFMAMVFTVMVTLSLYALAYFGAGVRFDAHVWMLLVGLNMFTTLPFACLGLAIGLRAKAQAAAAITNLAFFGLSILGGLWVPLTIFPDIMRTIAFALPSYHFGELALSVISQSDQANPAIHIIVALGYTFLFAYAAKRAWRNVDKDR